MFSQVAHDSKNNIYCWYDYRGVPSRWVEIKGRTFWKDENYERETLKQAASLGHFRAYPDIEKAHNPIPANIDNLFILFPRLF